MCRLETGLSLTILILNRNDIWKKENTRRLKLIKNNIKWKDINTKFNMSVRQRRAELHSDIGRWNKKLTVDKLRDLNAIVTLWSDIENEKRAFSLRAWFLPRRSMCLLAAHWMLIFMQFYLKKRVGTTTKSRSILYCLFVTKSEHILLEYYLRQFGCVWLRSSYMYLFRVRSFISPYPCRSFSDQRKQCTRFIGDDTVLCVIVCTCPDV